MKGKMLRVIYCVLSNLTVILFETAVLWLHPGEGMARINAAGEEEIYGATKAAAASATAARAPQPPARCAAGEELLRRVHADPKPCTPQMFIDLEIQPFKKLLGAQSGPLGADRPHPCTATPTAFIVPDLLWANLPSPGIVANLAPRAPQDTAYNHGKQREVPFCCCLPWLWGLVSSLQA